MVGRRCGAAEAAQQRGPTLHCGYSFLETALVMRLHILGDLHLEFGPANIPKSKADVVVLAGDVHVGNKGLEWVKSHFDNKPLVYVLGNHEFYLHALPELTERLKGETEGSHIHLLENGAVELAGFTFLGCTLWTDFALGSKPETAMEAAEERMNDYRIIRFSPENRVLRARDTEKIHQQSVAWLKSELARHDPTRTVVVTHHAPSPQSEAPYHTRSRIRSALASDLNALIEESRIPLWIHGHTHFNVDYRIGSTRVLTNQRGYPSQPCRGFDPRMVIEL
jgi:predicted phosphodiesterase